MDPSLSAEVPTHAMTLGLADILQAETILVLATGDEKAPALQKAFASPNNSDIPVSHLVENPNVLWLLDESQNMYKSMTSEVFLPVNYYPIW